MQTMSILSRREVVRGIAATPAVAAATFTAAVSPDATLVALGVQFDEIARAIDSAIEQRRHFNALNTLLPRFDVVEAAILATEAKTIRGLQIKARAAHCALLGNLEPAVQATSDQRMSLSIIGDLIALDASICGATAQNTDIRRTRVVRQFESGLRHVVGAQ